MAWLPLSPPLPAPGSTAWSKQMATAWRMVAAAVLLTVGAPLAVARERKQSDSICPVASCTGEGGRWAALAGHAGEAGLLQKGACCL
jgi:hypothetical protein